MHAHDDRRRVLRHSPVHCLMPGLFRSLPARAGGRPVLRVDYQVGDVTYEVHGPQALGVDDWWTMIGLLSLVQQRGQERLLPPSPVTAEGREVRESLHLSDDATDDDTLMVSTTWASLARSIGLTPSGPVIAGLRHSVERMWMVSVIEQRGRRRRGMRLIGRYWSDDGRVHIAIDPILARAVLRVGPYVRMLLADLRALRRCGAAALMYGHLAGYLRAGESRRVGIDTLAQYIYGDAATGAAARKRRQRTQEALRELVALGWSVEPVGSDTYVIRRPADEGIVDDA